MLECTYQYLAVCKQSTQHRSCIVFVIIDSQAKTDNTSKYSKEKKHLSCYVCETPTFELVSHTNVTWLCCVTNSVVGRVYLHAYKYVSAIDSY